MSGGIALDLDTRWEWSASGLGRFTPGERVLGTHFVRGWVGPKAGMNAVEEIKIYFLCLESKPNSWVVQPVAYSLYQLSYPGCSKQKLAEPYNSV
jgi:hypothetical protein